MNAKQQQPVIIYAGDMISVNCGIYQHVGIFVNNNQVVHNDKQSGVVLSTFSQFSGAAAIQLHKRALGNRQAIVQKAYSLIGQKYDLLKFNCEHAANLAQSGKAESPQLGAWTILATLCFGIFLVSRI